MTNRKIIYKPIPDAIQELVRTHGGDRSDVLEILRDLDRQQKLNPESVTDTAPPWDCPLQSCLE